MPISLSAFCLILCQKLYAGKNIEDNANAAKKYFTERKIGERSELHAINRIGQKKSGRVIQNRKLEDIFEKTLSAWMKTSERGKTEEINMVVAFDNAHIDDDLMDEDDVFGEENE